LAILTDKLSERRLVTDFSLRALRFEGNRLPWHIKVTFLVEFLHRWGLLCLLLIKLLALLVLSKDRPHSPILCEQVCPKRFRVLEIGDGHADRLITSSLTSLHPHRGGLRPRPRPTLRSTFRH
jgi:hypothetical protein